MPRSIEISLPAAAADRLLGELKSERGIVGMSRIRDASVEPPGDVVTIRATNEGLEKVQHALARHNIGPRGSMATSEPNSLISPLHERELAVETNEASWPEMASLLRRETNLSANYIIAMFTSGAVAAAGLWTDTLHIVIGAMVIAPGFEPIIRVPFGILARERKSWTRGLMSTAAGYAALALGAAAAFLILKLIEASPGDLSSRSWVQYWSSIKPSSVLIALAAGAAGAAIIAAQRSVLSAGVMIALALIPGMAIAGMASIEGDFALAAKGLARWAIDAGCVIVAGGLVFLLKRNRAHGGERAARASGPL